MRLPPQGGLPPLDGLVGTVVEIACDESGFSGSNLLDVATPVIAHASVVPPASRVRTTSISSARASS